MEEKKFESMNGLLYIYIYMHLRALALNLLAEILMYYMYILICPYFANLINVYAYRARLHAWTHVDIGFM